MSAVSINTLKTDQDIQLRQKLVMFHSGRCGSGVLGDLLNQHPNVHWDGETYANSRKTDREMRGEEFVGDPIQTVQKRMGQIDSDKVFGFEVQFFHLREYAIAVADYVAGLRTLGVSDFIVLRRRNTLRQLVSNRIGHRTAMWHLRTDETPKITPITIDISHVWTKKKSHHLLLVLENFSRNPENLLNMLSAENVLDLKYEADIQDNPLIAYRRCCQFLNLPVIEDVEVRFRKSNPYPLYELIENFAEVEATLQGTPFEWMLND